jgi:ATP adenylyltransferase
MNQQSDQTLPSVEETASSDAGSAAIVDASMEDGDSNSVGLRRLWTPWRMTYVGGGRRETGCIFCNRLAANDDTESLILHRGPRSFVIMNLFPYNTGHVMIVPNQHFASPEVADVETLAEMAAMRSPVLRALRRTLSADGFNIGLNVGAVAGAGVADHLHEHVVPRWQGDANFMPILAGTMVLPELIPVTYAKLRAELSRELDAIHQVTFLVFDRDHRQVLIHADGSLPSVVPDPAEPVWKTVLREANGLGLASAEIVGWGGPALTTNPGTAFAIAADHDTDSSPPGYRWTALSEVEPVALSGTDVPSRGMGEHGKQS